MPRVLMIFADAISITMRAHSASLRPSLHGRGALGSPSGSLPPSLWTASDGEFAVPALRAITSPQLLGR